MEAPRIEEFFVVTFEDGDGNPYLLCNSDGSIASHETAEDAETCISKPYRQVSVTNPVPLLFEAQLKLKAVAVTMGILKCEIPVPFTVQALRCTWGVVYGIKLPEGNWLRVKEVA